MTVTPEIVPPTPADLPTGVRLIVADNAGPMTLSGTNTYLVDLDGFGTVVLDPGPALPAHIDAVAAGPAALIILTHHHGDHTDAAPAVAERTGAVMRAQSTHWSRGAQPLTDGEIIGEGDRRLRVIHTPGHTADSLCLVLETGWLGGSGTPEVVFTGDTLLGGSTTVIIDGDGDVTNYLGSLDRLATLGDTPALPAHGHRLDSIAATCASTRAHRQERLDGIQAILDREGIPASTDDATVDRMVDLVYPDIDQTVRAPVSRMLAAQLRHLQRLAD